jgi:arginine deiminase
VASSTAGRASSSQPAPSIRSEVGRLRTVLVHRPGEELRRITPSTMDELLFDELLWVEQAQAEHDAMTDIMRQAGVEVLYVEELLAEVVEADSALAREIVDLHVTGSTCGPQALERVRDVLLGGTARELADHLIAGVTLEEIGALDGLVVAASDPTSLVLAPLPNLVFSRDSAAWVGEGVVLSPMNRMVRRRETDLLGSVYHLHPRFKDVPIWFGDRATDGFPATFEGGDLLMVGERGVAIGISERTSAAGVEMLATRLFQAGVVDRVLAIDLPKVRAAMHLDTIVTQVDVDAFITYPRMTSELRCMMVTPSPNGVHVSDAAGLMQGSRGRPGSTTPGRSSRRSGRSAPSASSGTTRTTPSRSPPARSSPTSATSSPTRSSTRPASRSTRSRPTSCPAAAAARAA